MTYFGYIYLYIQNPIFVFFIWHIFLEKLLKLKLLQERHLVCCKVCMMRTENKWNVNM